MIKTPTQYSFHPCFYLQTLLFELFKNQSKFLYEYCNDRISTLQIPIYCPCVLDYCQYDVRTIQTQNICLSISEILVKLL